MSSETTNHSYVLSEQHTARLPPPMDSSFGRPLSTIESIASSTDEADDDESEGSNDAARNDFDKAETMKSDLKAHIYELIRISNTLSDERIGKSSSSSASTEGKDKDFVMLKNLPRLLAEYEKEKGQALLNDEARPVLDEYARTSPNLELGVESLEQMIVMLNESLVDLESKDVGEETLMQIRDDNSNQEMKFDRRQPSTTSESGTDASSVDDDDYSYDRDVNFQESKHQIVESVMIPRSKYNFPRSKSEKIIPSEGKDTNSKSHDNTFAPMMARSKRTTSDPMAPPPTHNRRVSASAVQTSSSGRQEMKEMRKYSEGVDREILRGKGKAKVPPSSWSNTRPRPPALARKDRQRRISDLSSTRSDDFDQENIDGSSTLGSPESQQSMLGIGTPSRLPRNRLSSHSEVLREINGVRLPRSASSASAGFVFPRNKSLQLGEEQNEEYDEDNIKDDDPSPLAPSFPRKNSSRAASPILDEQSYHNFSALSPTHNNEYPSSPPLEGRSSRRSSEAGRRRTLVGEGLDIENTSDAIAVRARLEAMSRQITEQEKKHNAIQQEHESIISRLQDELDESKALISTKKREEKESKARENSHMDSIASLEADLNKAEKALETTREHLAKSRADYDEQVLETGRLRGKLNAIQEDVEKLKVEERLHMEATKMWENDREVYREKISLLHTQIDQVEDEAMKLEDSERENKLLKEQLERLNVEMDDLRRGSSLMGSIRSKGSGIDATMSKRLGSELARQLERAKEEEEGGSDDTDEGMKTGDGDESIEHIYLVEKRRSRKSRSRVETQQTSSEPPTYDEAAHEKQVSDRLHPLCKKGLILTHQNVAYREVVNRSGIRCTVLESHLQSSSSPIQTLNGTASWFTQVSLFKQYCIRLLSDLASSLPLLESTLATLRRITHEKNGRQSLPVLTLYLGFIVGLLLSVLTCFALTPLHRSSPGQFLTEDWAVSNGLELIWGSHGPRIPSNQPGFLNKLWPSHSYDFTIRIPT